MPAVKREYTATPPPTGPDAADAETKPSMSASEGEDELDYDSSSDFDTTPTKTKSNGKRTKGKATVKGKASKTESPSPKKRKSDSFPAATSALTPEKKQRIVAEIFIAGCGVINVQQLAAELEITPKQIQNAIGSGRKGNLRDKVIGGAGLGI